MTRNNYDQTFKEMLVDLYQTGQSVLELSKEYGVNAGTIYKWIDLYGKDEPTDLSKAELVLLRSLKNQILELNSLLLLSRYTD